MYWRTSFWLRSVRTWAWVEGAASTRGMNCILMSFSDG